MEAKPDIKINQTLKLIYEKIPFEEALRQANRHMNSFVTFLKNYLFQLIEPIIKRYIDTFVMVEIKALKDVLKTQKADTEDLKIELEALKKRVNQLAVMEAGPITNHKTSSDYEKYRKEAVSIIKDLLFKGLSRQKIASHLNEKGMPTLSGRGEWHRSTISKIIREESIETENG